MTARQGALAQAGVQPAVGVPITVRRETGPRPRIFRLAPSVGVGKAGWRVVSFVQWPLLGIIGVDAR